MRIASIKRNKHTSRVKGRTHGGGKKRAHNVGKNPYKRGGSRS